MNAIYCNHEFKLFDSEREKCTKCYLTRRLDELEREARAAGTPAQVNSVSGPEPDEWLETEAAQARLRAAESEIAAEELKRLTPAEVVTLGALETLAAAIEFGATLEIQGSSSVLEPMKERPIRATIASPSGARYATVFGAELDGVLQELARSWSAQIEPDLHEPPRCAHCGVGFVGRLRETHIDIDHGVPICLPFASKDERERERCIPKQGSEAVARWFLAQAHAEADRREAELRGRTS